MKNNFKSLEGNFNNFAQQVVYVDKTESTMNLAWDYADKKKSHGLLIITDFQTQGRGRFNRTWISHPKKDLLFSIILKLPTKMLNQLLMISSLSIYDLLFSLEMNPQIKWPNDVLINHKKIAGVIAESRVLSDELSYVVIGIGLNVNLSLPAESPVADTYTSLYKEKNIQFERYELLKQLLANLDNYYSYITSGKNIVPKWKQKVINIGENIKISFNNNENNNSIKGKAIDIDDEGRIVILDKNMKEWHVSSGEVTVIST